MKLPFSCGTCDGRPSLQLLLVPTACPPFPGESPRNSCRAAPSSGPSEDRIPGKPPVRLRGSSHARYPEDIPPPCSASGRRHQIQVASRDKTRRAAGQNRVCARPDGDSSAQHGKPPRSSRESDPAPGSRKGDSIAVNIYDAYSAGPSV